MSRPRTWKGHPTPASTRSERRRNHPKRPKAPRPLAVWNAHGKGRKAPHSPRLIRRLLPYLTRPAAKGTRRRAKAIARIRREHLRIGAPVPAGLR